jgi:hypothetical protein
LVGDPEGSTASPPGSPLTAFSMNLNGFRTRNDQQYLDAPPRHVGPGFAAASFGPNHVISGSRFSTNSRLPVWSINVLQGPEPLQDGHYARFAAAKPTENGNLISLEKPLKKLEKALKDRRET